MRGTKAKPSARKGQERSLESIVAELRSELEAAGAVPKTALAKRSGKARLLEVIDALTAAGYELGARHLRVPLETQIEKRIASESPVALRGLEAHVAGATASEVKAAARELVDRRRARFVVRGRELLLHGASADVVDAERLARVIADLVAALRTATKHKAALLRADVEAALQPFSAKPAAVAPLAVRDVASLVEQHREPSGLTSVPRLVRMLGGMEVRAAVHAELLRGARAGRFELRPESGMGRLSAEDAAFCIPGPQGSRLSWVRRIEEPA